MDPPPPPSTAAKCGMETLTCQRCFDGRRLSSGQTIHAHEQTGGSLNHVRVDASANQFCSVMYLNWDRRERIICCVPEMAGRSERSGARSPTTFDGDVLRRRFFHQSKADTRGFRLVKESASKDITINRCRRIESMTMIHQHIRKTIKFTNDVNI